MSSKVRRLHSASGSMTHLAAILDYAIHAKRLSASKCFSKDHRTEAGGAGRNYWSGFISDKNRGKCSPIARSTTSEKRNACSVVNSYRRDSFMIHPCRCDDVRHAQTRDRAAQVNVVRNSHNATMNIDPRCGWRPRRSINEHVMSGCKGVLAAVLLCALSDIREGNGYSTDAKVWLDSDREDHPITFRRVCDSLDLSPDAVRRAARNRKGRR